MPETIGGVQYELGVDMRKLKTGFSDAEKQATASGKRVESAWGRGAARGIDKTTKSASGLRGVLASPQMRQGIMQGLGLGAGAIGALAVAKGIDVMKDAIVGSVQAAAQLDEAMTTSLAIMGDVSDTMRDQMTQAARDMAKATVFSAKEAADSYYFLASAGFDAAQSLRALPIVADFAQAGMFDMAQATDLLTDAQSALGLSSEDTAESMQNMARVGDVLVKANTLANASVEQFSEALTNRGAAALRLVGKEIEEGTALLAAWADQGVKGAEAGTRLDVVLRDLQNAALKNGAAFKEYGVQVFDADGEMRNMADIIEQLEGAFGGLSDRAVRAGLSQLGFQQKTVSATASLIGLSSKVRDYEDGLSDAGGTMKTVAEKQLETFNRKLGLLNSSMEDFGISLGDWMLDPLTDLVNYLNDEVIPGVEEFIDSITKSPEMRLQRNIERGLQQIGERFRLTDAQVNELKQSLVAQVAAIYSNKDAWTEDLDTLEGVVATMIHLASTGDGLLEFFTRFNDQLRRTKSDAEGADDEVDELATSLNRLRDNLDEYANTRSLGKINAEIRKHRKEMLEAAREGDEVAWARAKHALQEARQERNAAQRRSEDFKAWQREQRRRKRGEQELEEATRAREREITRVARAHNVSEGKIRRELEKTGGDIDKVKEKLKNTKTKVEELDKTSATPTVDVDDSEARRKIAQIRGQLRLLNAAAPLYYPGNTAAAPWPGGWDSDPSTPWPTAAGGWRPRGAFTLVGEQGPELRIEPTSAYYLNSQDTESVMRSLAQPRRMDHYHHLDQASAQNLRTAGYDEAGIVALLRDASRQADTHYRYGG